MHRVTFDDQPICFDVLLPGQGMGFISATLMIYMSDEDTFACLTTLCQQYDMAGLFQVTYHRLRKKTKHRVVGAAERLLF